MATRCKVVAVLTLTDHESGQSWPETAIFDETAPIEDVLLWAEKRNQGFRPHERMILSGETRKDVMRNFIGNLQLTIGWFDREDGNNEA